MNKPNGQPVFRRPAYRSPLDRRFRLRLAGLADVNRMKMDLTLLMVAA